MKSKCSFINTSEETKRSIDRIENGKCTKSESFFVGCVERIEMYRIQHEQFDKDKDLQNSYKYNELQKSLEFSQAKIAELRTSNSDLQTKVKSLEKRNWDIKK